MEQEGKKGGWVKSGQKQGGKEREKKHVGKMQCFGAFSQFEPICPHFSAFFSMDMLIVLQGVRSQLAELIP